MNPNLQELRHRDVGIDRAVRQADAARVMALDDEPHPLVEAKRARIALSHSQLDALDLWRHGGRRGEQALEEARPDAPALPVGVHRHG